MTHNLFRIKIVTYVILMQVSIIIPTYNRANDLCECLDSLIIQTTLPKEIIIVDDSNNDEINNLIQHRKNEFIGKRISLIYIKNHRDKSSAISRNIGTDNSTGDVILFLDGDVILDSEYITETLKVYNKYPNVLGLQGYIIDETKETFYQKVSNIINTIFYLSHFENNRCRVLPSTYGTYPKLTGKEKLIQCEWLSGTNCSYRGVILDDFKFDEKLRRYSYNEDTDLSFRIFQKYPDSLLMTAHAKLMHKESKEGRHPRKVLIYMSVIYLVYFFYKNIEPDFKNKLIFIWSMIGKTIIEILHLIMSPSKSRIIRLKYLFSAYLCCMKHMKDLKMLNLNFFDVG